MKSIYKSIASLQQEIEVIHKDTPGFNYSYADLPAVLKILNPEMKKHGLGFYQVINGTQLKTVVFHTESSEFIESNMDIPQNVELAKMNQFQVLGSAITYLRRYSLSAMLGLVTDKDTDAQGEQVTYAKKEKKEIVPREIRVLELSEVLGMIEKNNVVDLLQQMLGRLESANNIKSEDKETVRKALEEKIDSLTI